MIWKLIAGNRPNQETREQKRAEAQRYIEMLEKENTVVVKEFENYLEIQYEPIGNRSKADSDKR